MPFESIVLMILGTFATANDSKINEMVDKGADTVLGAVADSETKLDDFAARELADKLERFAARVKAGLPPA